MLEFRPNGPHLAFIIKIFGTALNLCAFAALLFALNLAQDRFKTVCRVAQLALLSTFLLSLPEYSLRIHERY
jgi:hypothetical protein